MRFPLSIKDNILFLFILLFLSKHDKCTTNSNNISFPNKYVYLSSCKILNNNIIIQKDIDTCKDFVLLYSMVNKTGKTLEDINLIVTVNRHDTIFNYREALDPHDSVCRNRSINCSKFMKGINTVEICMIYRNIILDRKKLICNIQFINIKNESEKAKIEGLIVKMPNYEFHPELDSNGKMNNLISVYPRFDAIANRRYESSALNLKFRIVDGNAKITKARDCLASDFAPFCDAVICENCFVFKLADTSNVKFEVILNYQDLEILRDTIVYNSDHIPFYPDANTYGKKDKSLLH